MCSENTKISICSKKMFALEQPEVFSNTDALWPDRFSQKVLKTLQCLISEGVKARKGKGEPHGPLKGQVSLSLGSSLLADLVGLSAQREPVHLNCSGANLAGCHFLHEKRTGAMEGAKCQPWKCHCWPSNTETTETKRDFMSLNDLIVAYCRIKRVGAC